MHHCVYCLINVKWYFCCYLFVSISSFEKEEEDKEEDKEVEEEKKEEEEDYKKEEEEEAEKEEEVLDFPYTYIHTEATYTS